MDRHELHGLSKFEKETWLNLLAADDQWKDEATDLRRLKKKSLSDTTEEEDDLILIEDDDDEEADDAMDVDADIPADEADDQQVIDTLDEQMMDDLAETRQTGTWVKKGERKESDIPDEPSSAASSSGAKETGSSSRTWAPRARSHTPSRTVLKKAGRFHEQSRSPSADRRKVTFSDIPETKFFETSPKKRAASRAQEVMRDAAEAHKADFEFKRRPEFMTCLACSQGEVLFFFVEHADTAPVSIAIMKRAISVHLQRDVSELDHPRRRHSGTFGRA